jgi:octaprenyl-diphosphate synthase
LSMPSSFDQIKQHISTELKTFDGYFNNVMKTDIPLLNLVMRYILRKKGKQMRPVLVFLSAKLHGTPGDATYTAAALIEILHTATLIHDDVVDESNERRGFFSINALWRSKIAVLVGDYLLAKGLLLAVGNKQYEILDLVSNAVKEMSEGELMQIRNTRKLKISESSYFEIIRKKTATLISVCSSCGAKSVGADAETVKNMNDFGEMLGIAFQIKDDLLDYQVNNLTGKPAGNDIQEKKLTLPLIHALNQSTHSERDHILHIMNSSAKSKAKFNEVLSFIHKHQGISYAETKMKEFAALAKQKLSIYGTESSRQDLNEFIDYAILRNK